MAIMEISVVPIGTQSPSVSPFVAECVKIVDQQGLKYEVTSMGTEVEGKVEELLSLAYPLQKGPSGCSPPSGLTNAGTKKCG